METKHEGTGVVFQGCFMVSSFGRATELVDIDDQVAPQAYVVSLRLQMIAEQRSKRGESLAEAVAGCAGLGIGPERLDQIVAGVGAAGLKGKKGEEECGLVGTESRRRALTTNDPG